MTAWLSVAVVEARGEAEVAAARPPRAAEEGRNVPHLAPKPACPKWVVRRGSQADPQRAGPVRVVQSPGRVQVDLRSVPISANQVVGSSQAAGLPAAPTGARVLITVRDPQHAREVLDRACLGPAHLAPPTLNDRTPACPASVRDQVEVVLRWRSDLTTSVLTLARVHRRVLDLIAQILATSPGAISQV